MARHYRSLEVLLLAALLLLDACGTPVWAFLIRPQATHNGRTIYVSRPHVWWMSPDMAEYITERYSSPVHEFATNVAYGCCAYNTIEPVNCTRVATNPWEATKESLAFPAVVAGIQWNDNPPFQLDSTRDPLCKPYIGRVIKLPFAAECWYVLFADAEKKAKKGKFFDAASGTVLLYRVHFGDMQFLHSMAAKDGESAHDTQAAILNWAEFVYKVATGEIPRGTPLNKISVPGIKELFKSGGTVQQLFIRGDATYFDEADFRNVAFGSLLHMVQDSFSESHTRRDTPTGDKCIGTAIFKPGAIQGFSCYTNQDRENHQQQDTQQALAAGMAENRPHVVDVTNELKNYYQQNKPWEEVKNYLGCVFELKIPVAASGL